MGLIGSADEFANGIQIKTTSQNSVSQTIKVAAHRKGVDFSYLLNQAQAESSLNPQAEAKTSSATGLFQFINSTWLNVVDKYGAQNGYGEYADQIERDFQGRLYVADPAVKQEILDLRKDPKAASIFAAELALENQTFLEKNFNGDIGSTELYFAHFLGARGASEFLNAHEANPQADAATLFPKAAQANKNVFFNKDGSSKSLNEVYAFFDGKFQDNDDKAVAANVELAQKPEALPTQDIRSRLVREPYRPARIVDLPDRFSPKIERFVNNKGFQELQNQVNLTQNSFLTSQLNNTLLSSLNLSLLRNSAF